MSTTRLMILGLVHWMQPVHGYDVRRELESWHVDEWANIAPGSIYHALRRLAEEGMLEEVATERVGGRPARTSYRVTTRGEAEFTQLLWRYWWEYQPPIDPFLAGFAFLPRLARVEAVAALRNRARVLRTMVEMRRVTLAAGLLGSREHRSEGQPRARGARNEPRSREQTGHSARSGPAEPTEQSMRAQKPAHVGWQFELVIDRMETEIAWCERIASRLEGGAELFPAGMPGWSGAAVDDRSAADAPEPEAVRSVPPAPPGRETVPDTSNNLR